MVGNGELRDSARAEVRGNPEANAGHVVGNEEATTITLPVSRLKRSLHLSETYGAAFDFYAVATDHVRLLHCDVRADVVIRPTRRGRQNIRFRSVTSGTNVSAHL